MLKRKSPVAVRPPYTNLLLIREGDVLVVADISKRRQPFEDVLLFGGLASQVEVNSFFEVQSSPTPPSQSFGDEEEFAEFLLSGWLDEVEAKEVAASQESLQAGSVGQANMTKRIRSGLLARDTRMEGLERMAI